MYSEFVRDRITQLRIQKGISEYKMSYDLGHSRGYINNISSGKSLPSMTEFFAICEYFDITPIDFFEFYDERVPNPNLLGLTISALEQLEESDLELTYRTVTRLLKR